MEAPLVNDRPRGILRGEAPLYSRLRKDFTRLCCVIREVKRIESVLQLKIADEWEQFIFVPREFYILEGPFSVASEQEETLRCCSLATDMF